MNKKLNHLVFYIFSDDIEWCKKNFEWVEQKFFIEGNMVEQDFELIKNCKHNIIANSSLSQWAAYFNNNLKKIVIAPKVFTMFPKKNFNKNRVICDGLPNDWIRI